MRPIAVLSAVLAGLVFVPSAQAGPAQAGSAQAGDAKPVTFAVIGDTPYGAEQLADFPALVDAINDDGPVREVLHLGDIKTGSSPCTDDYNRRIYSEFGQFTDPLLYTPGDNEWTDCHRTAAGGYDPLDRLAAVRSTFFPNPGEPLGRRSLELKTQASVQDYRAFVENVRADPQAQTVLATVHVVGSNNGLDPWFGGVETPEQTERRLAEVRGRTAAAVAWIDAAFDAAERSGARGVVIAMQADTFIDGGNTGYADIVQRLADRARAFDGEVLLLQGDSHRYLVDKPLANGHAGYGITEPVPNLTRVVVEGETASEYLRLTIDPDAERLFSWERVTVPS